MVTVLRASGLRVVIFLNDHPPAHVQVLADGEVKINLFGPDGAPLMIWAEGMNRSEVRRAMNIVTDNKLFLMSRWEDIRGRYD